MDIVEEYDLKRNYMRVFGLSMEMLLQGAIYFIARLVGN